MGGGPYPAICAPALRPCSLFTVTVSAFLTTSTKGPPSNVWSVLLATDFALSLSWRARRDLYSLGGRSLRVVPSTARFHWLSVEGDQPAVKTDRMKGQEAGTHERHLTHGRSPSHAMPSIRLRTLTNDRRLELPTDDLVIHSCGQSFRAGLVERGGVALISFPCKEMGGGNIFSHLLLGTVLEIVPGE
jgi:hypothetical protein